MRKLQWLVIAFFFFFFSCTKIETTNIGSGLIPPIDGVTTLDTTLDIVSNNFVNRLNDSLKVYKQDDHVIGVINNDPLFGKTTASAYFELKPTSYKFAIPGGSSTIADSAVLILSYKGAYGDTMMQQNWEVRELSQSLKTDSAYSVSSTFSTGTVLGTKTIDIPSVTDSVKYGLENAANQIRIKLSPSFATKLIKQFDSLGTNAYASDSLFRVNFKGFAVMPAGGSPGNALIRINLLDTNTKLALFYNFKSSESATTRDTAVSYFRFSTGNTFSVPVSGSANHIKREHGSSQLARFTSNPEANDSLVFIQTAPGTFATIKIPKLRGFPNAIIHKAELMAFQATPLSLLEQVLTPPRFLLLSSYDSGNKVQTNVPNDFVMDNTGSFNLATFGGYLMDKDVPGAGIVKAYSFELTRYVQGIVTRKDSSYTLRLSAPSNDSLKYTFPYPANTNTSTFYFSPNNANQVANGRVRLGGGGMSEANPLRMRLRLIYSKI
ncbi:MAG: hypothetical protein JWQ40_2001 [Segetibacter sp.]|nr:hypothetical protein [Segetibacter sp.]